jgi:hypothetical protein
MNKMFYAVYPLAANNSKCIIIVNDRMEIINDSTAHLQYLLDLNSTSL